MAGKEGFKCPLLIAVVLILQPVGQIPMDLETWQQWQHREISDRQSPAAGQITWSGTLELSTNSQKV